MEINWKEAAKKYYDEYGHSEDYIFEWVDNYVPIYYNDIALEAAKMGCISENVEATAVGYPVYKYLQMLIFIKYEMFFMEEFRMLVEEEE